MITLTHGKNILTNVGTRKEREFGRGIPNANYGQAADARNNIVKEHRV